MGTHKTRDIRSALLGKGFRESETHHEMYWFYAGERKTSVRTRISHGCNEYGDSLLSQMATQLKLRRRDLDDLIACPLSGEEYLERLLQGEHVRLDA